MDNKDPKKIHQDHEIELSESADINHVCSFEVTVSEVAISYKCICGNSFGQILE